jgi:hypothetical protein
MGAAGDVAARARAWHHGVHAAVCDVFDPWAFGTVVRAKRYPTYFDLNVVRVEEDPGMSVDALVAIADEALAGLAHRRLNFECAGAAEPLRAGFAARGWESERLVWMLHETGRPSGRGGIALEEVPYDAVHALRVAWLGEDFPNLQPGAYFAEAREVALLLGARGSAPP